MNTKPLSRRKLQQTAGEIGWTHNMVMIDKCKSLEERPFYFDKALPEKYRNRAKLAVKEEYNLEFLELTEKHNKKELELAIMTNMRHFLSEMGGDFAFIGVK